MFDSKNDYALNKMNPEAIVCKSVTGLHIRLTCADFASEDEFNHWKGWSDSDYYDTVNGGRDFYDNCIPLEEAVSSIGISAEDTFFLPQLQAERETQRAAQLQQVKDLLTEAQYRRLLMHCINGMTVDEISAVEHIAHQNVSKSIRAAWRKIKKFFHEP